MGLKIVDVSELAYGGMVTGLEFWDKKRIEGATLKKKELHKKVGFYGYLIPGLYGVVTTGFDLVRSQRNINERLAHGFIYDFPRFTLGLVESFKKNNPGNPGNLQLADGRRLALKQGMSAEQVAQQLAGQGQRQTAGATAEI